MPVGRFRADPRDLSAAERKAYALQLPEGLHVIGSGLGLAGPILLGRLGPLDGSVLGSPVAAVLGLFVGGIGGYLVGYWLLQRRLADSPAAEEAEAPATAEATESTAPEVSTESR